MRNSSRFIEGASYTQQEAAAINNRLTENAKQAALVAQALLAMQREALGIKIPQEGQGIVCNPVLGVTKNM